MDVRAGGATFASLLSGGALLSARSAYFRDATFGPEGPTLDKLKINN